MLPSTLDILPSTLDILPSTLDFVPSTLDPRPKPKLKTLLYLQNGKAQISISSVSPTKELITDTGNRDQVFLATPLGLFSNLPGPLPITSCVKTYETCEVELWWLMLLADIFCRQNVKSSVYVAVSPSHDKKKMKKGRGPALKFRHTKIQSKNQLK